MSSSERRATDVATDLHSRRRATDAPPPPPPTVPPARPFGGSRIGSIDVARALAVIGVVVNHAVDGLVESEVLPAGSRIARLNEVLYTFRMPALAFLLGLLVHGAVRKHGSWTYVARRVTLFLYLYLVWFYIQGAVEVAANGVKNHARSPFSSLEPWVPFGQLWFLPCMAVITALVVWLGPWFSRWRAGVSYLICAALTLGFWGFNPEIAGVHGLSLALFVLIGISMGTRQYRRLESGSAWIWAGVLVAGVAVLVAANLGGAVPPTNGQVRPDMPTILVSMLAAGGGVVALVAVAVLVSRVGGPVMRALDSIGTQTLVIFLGHVAVVAATRIVLVQLGVTEPVAILAIAVPLGVVVPLALGIVARDRPWLSWLVTTPRWVVRLRRWLATTRPRRRRATGPRA